MPHQNLAVQIRPVEIRHWRTRDSWGNSPGMRVFEKLQLWVDPVSRTGPEAMAVDEWLLEVAECPVLRVYGWSGGWASLGYFGHIEEARKLFPGLDLVRRWTGGGMVDHRADWTYTLAVPKGEPLASTRGADSYGWIHSVLSEVLREEGKPCEVSGGEGETGAAMCFDNPVGFDLVHLDGAKLAGAGQRRSRIGLLHQGSVDSPLPVESSADRARSFAAALAGEVGSFTQLPEGGEIARLMQRRYSRPEWTFRR